MAGVDPKIAYHKQDVNLHIKPIKSKMKRMNLDHSSNSKPKWIGYYRLILSKRLSTRDGVSNIVVVPKKNGKIRCEQTLLISINLVQCTLSDAKDL